MTWTNTSGVCENRVMLADTDVLIWFLRGRNSARATLEECAPVQLSAVTYMELAQGARSTAEIRLLRKTIRESGWRIEPLTESISFRAIAFIESHALSHGLRLADALIAATCVELGLTLITANVRHYQSLPGISLRRYRP